jgi:hypothetical protein
MAISPHGDPQSRHHRKRQWKEEQGKGGTCDGAVVMTDRSLKFLRPCAVSALSEKCY